MYSLGKSVVFLCAAIAATAFNLGDRDVIFHLYKRANPTISQPMFPSALSIMSTNFALEHDTVITIHGHNDSAGGNFNAFVIPAHLRAADVNVVAVDWSIGTGMYTQGLANAVQCGEVIAEFINILHNDFNYPLSRVRIVGVGLGGHIAGIAARNVDGEIPHITAIDPSLHGWSHSPDKLNYNDAEVVEVLHVTAGYQGYDEPLGDIDFYPNGGSYQTGCGINISCSQTYGYAFYAESIRQEEEGGNEFVGTACESYEEAKAQQCSGDKDAVFGGSGDKTSVFGIYHFRTNPLPPFARG